MIKLKTINKVLRLFGFVLVVTVGDDRPTTLHFERSKKFDAKKERKL